MNENHVFGMIILTAIISFVVGWMVGKYCAYERIKRTYAEKMSELVLRIEKMEKLSKKEHELEDEKANLKYEREMLRLQNESIRREMMNVARNDAIDELKRAQKKFPYM